MNNIANAEKQSITHNGDTITKKELLTYFLNVLKIRAEISNVTKIINEQDNLIQGLSLDLKRREFHIPQMSPPKGLSAFSPKKQRIYKSWLAGSHIREAELAEKEDAEDRRIFNVQNQLKELEQEQKRNLELLGELNSKHSEFLALHVLSSEYMEENTLATIVRYFVSNRADTITEALNLYHQEQHWKHMENIAKQQMTESAASHKRQEYLQQYHSAQMAIMQQEQAREMHNALTDIKRSADDAKFYSELNLFLNLLD